MIETFFNSSTVSKGGDDKRKDRVGGKKSNSRKLIENSKLHNLFAFENNVSRQNRLKKRFRRVNPSLVDFLHKVKGLNYLYYDSSILDFVEFSISGEVR